MNTESSNKSYPVMKIVTQNAQEFLTKRIRFRKFKIAYRNIQGTCNVPFKQSEQEKEEKKESKLKTMTKKTKRDRNKLHYLQG